LGWKASSPSAAEEGWQLPHGKLFRKQNRVVCELQVGGMCRTWVERRVGEWRESKGQVVVELVGGMRFEMERRGAELYLTGPERMPLRLKPI